MDIHFISTLTPEDEDRYAPMVKNAMRAILDLMPLSYTLRIETVNGRVFTHSKADTLDDANDPALRSAGHDAPVRRVGLF